MLTVKHRIPSQIISAPLYSSLRVSCKNLTSPATVSSPKPFKDIPTPKGYPLIGTALDYRNDKYTMSRVIKKRIDKFGPIYREVMFPGLPEQVIVWDPKDVETVFRVDGEWPQRPEGGDLLDRINKEAGITIPGLFNCNGEQWHKMRSPMSKFMMIPRKVGEYHEDLNNITLDLLANLELKKNPDSALLSDLPSLLFNWSFESVAFFTFRKRFGALSLNEAPPETQEYIDVVRKFFVALTDLLFSLPVYKIFPTKTRRDVIDTRTRMFKLSMKFINEKLAEMAEEERRALEAAGSEEEAPDKVDFITYLVHSGKLSLEEVSTIVQDILSAGVETTSYTLAWALYSLATNPEAQERLRSEILRVVGSDRIVTPDHINRMNYLRNTLKETQRLYPLAGFNQRILQEDVILSGYKVPKGTEVTMPQLLIGRMPELFSEPEKFSPERWKKENKHTLPSMFAQLPFGFGSRMCVGRRLAELEIHLALSHIIRKYRVEYHDKEPMGFVQSFLTKPERQLDLSFHKL